MKRNVKVLLCTMGLVSASVAHAYQTDITVNANIDPTVSLTQNDGTPIPSSVNMAYQVGKGLTAYKTNVKAWSNAELDLKFSLNGTAQLTDSAGSNSIPLTVMLNGTALSNTASTLQYSTLFPSGLSNGSMSLPLVISQTTPNGNLSAGSYSGVVSIIVAQGTTKDGNTPSA